MFPVLFAEGLYQSGNPSCFDGSVLIMAISGGAFIPLLHDQLMIRYGSGISLFMLALGYLFISAVGYYLYKQKVRRTSEDRSRETETAVSSGSEQ